MVCAYLGLRVPIIAEIVKNGDNDGAFTSTNGAIKAAQYCGFEIEARNISIGSLRDYTESGHLVVVSVTYGQIPNLYKQDLSWGGGHALLITGVTPDLKGIRYADPDFGLGGVNRDGGWMNNNKWISAQDFLPAWMDQFNLSFIVKNTKEDNMPDYSWLEGTPDSLDKTYIDPTLKALGENKADLSEKIKVVCDYAKQVPVLRKEIESLKKSEWTNVSARIKKALGY
jgi:hypothetical protein